MSLQIQFSEVRLGVSSTLSSIAPKTQTDLGASKVRAVWNSICYFFADLFCGNRDSWAKKIFPENCPYKQTKNFAQSWELGLYSQEEIHIDIDEDDKKEARALGVVYTNEHLTLCPVSAGFCLGGVVFFSSLVTQLNQKKGDGKPYTNDGFEVATAGFKGGMPLDAIYYQTFAEAVKNDPDTAKKGDYKTSFPFRLLNLKLKPVADWVPYEDFMDQIWRLPSGLYYIDLPFMTPFSTVAGWHAVLLGVGDKPNYSNIEKEVLNSFFFDPNCAMGAFSEPDVPGVITRLVQHYTGFNPLGTSWTQRVANFFKCQANPPFDSERRMFSIYEIVPTL